MIETIEFKGEIYPAFQSQGNAAQFAIPFARQILKYCQNTFDVGCKKIEWCYPGARPIDPELNKFDAVNFPYDQVPDSIFSSHMLEHYKGAWTEVLEYWHYKLCNKGIVFLYLPDHSQKYWRPHFNKKHVHSFTPKIIESYFKDQADLWENVFCSGVDLNNSFICTAQKK